MKHMINWTKQQTDRDGLRALITGIRNGEVWQYSVFVAYYTAVSLFPLVVGVFNAWNYFHIPSEPLIAWITKVVPGPFAQWVTTDLRQIYESAHVAILIVAAVATVWTVSWAMAAMQMGLNKAYGVGHRKNIVVLRLVAFLVTFVFAGVGGVLFAGIQLLGAPAAVSAPLYVLSAGLLIGMLYYLVPNVRQHWRDVWPGTLFSTVVFAAAGTAYYLFLRLIPEESTFYTTVGAFTFVMVLLQMMNMIVLIGGVLNAVLQRRKYGRVTEKNDTSKFLRAWSRAEKRFKKPD